MKSFIIKDMYNIAGYLKSMFFILVVIAVAIIPSSGAGSYIFASALMCSMMVITTFSFDDYSKWERYAMVMPVSRNNVVAGKFVDSLLFCIGGSLWGLIAGTIVEVITNRYTGNILELLLIAVTSIAVSMVFNSITLPFLFKFGAEKGRMLMVLSTFFPCGIIFGIYKLLGVIGLEFTDQLVHIIVGCSLIASVLWCFGMYKISCMVFADKEL